MRFPQWLVGFFTKRGKALSHYRRGMARARKRNHQGALDDYSVTIGMPDVPTDLKAMALYNRSLVHVAVGNEATGEIDLDAIIAMDGAPVNIRTMARQKLARIKSRSHEGKP